MKTVRICLVFLWDYSFLIILKQRVTSLAASLLCETQAAHPGNSFEEADTPPCAVMRLLCIFLTILAGALWGHLALNFYKCVLFYGNARNLRHQGKENFKWWGLQTDVSSLESFSTTILRTEASFIFSIWNQMAQLPANRILWAKRLEKASSQKAESFRMFWTLNWRQ